MNEILESLHRHPEIWIKPVVAFLITLAIAYVVRRIFLGGLHRWAERSGARALAVLHDTLRRPTQIWIFILAVHFAIQSSDLPGAVTRHAPEVLQVLFIVSLTVMFMRMAGDLVRNFGDQIPGAVPVTTLSQNLAQLAVLILGILIGLRVIGIEITPILTALGVGGLAVALALQDTLSNLFAGFYISVARQIRPGDYIKLNTGEEGYVTDISWRSTAMRGLSNNMIIVPNAKLAQANVTNYYLPEKRMGTSVEVSVGYESDIDHVERVLLEIGRKAVTEVPGMLPEPGPSVTLDPGFGDSALGFKLGFQIAEFSNQYSVRHEVRKRIFKRFREEGISMPFPQREVWLHNAPER
ncbi:MAG TPA: mechanosensitive ion channel family protein [Bryobacteraceae bacterium]|jgi:small-conductance mechanosensitive channel|nr:mechanosensitive ion channel family protein [Bryobacteraceae bacterium]